MFSEEEKDVIMTTLVNEKLEIIKKQKKLIEECTTLDEKIMFSMEEFHRYEVFCEAITTLTKIIEKVKQIN